MLREPRRGLNTPIVGVRVGVNVEVRVKGVVPTRTDPIGFEKRRSRGVSNHDAGA